MLMHGRLILSELLPRNSIAPRTTVSVTIPTCTPSTRTGTAGILSAILGSTTETRQYSYGCEHHGHSCRLEGRQRESRAWRVVHKSRIETACSLKKCSRSVGVS